MVLAAVTAGCDKRPSTPNEPTPTAAIPPFAGTWTSTASAGPCSGINYVVAPTGTTTANITYTATCGGIPVSATATGTASGSTLTWSTTGNAGGACAFVLNGTAVTDTPTTLRSTFTGTICGVAVSGTETLRR
jgi:hypothetical protein